MTVWKFSGRMKYAPITQMVECNICNIDVIGSNPIRGSEYL